MGQTHTVGKVSTTARMKDGVLSVVYHSTEVVHATPQAIILDSGGYRTHTTKTRMNQASNQYGLGYVVYQTKHVWYVSHKGVDTVFHDGMRLER